MKYAELASTAHHRAVLAQALILILAGTLGLLIVGESMSLPVTGLIESASTT